MKDDVFAVIADSTRRHILQALAAERSAVGELVEELGVGQPTVSKHLKVLRTAGLVETEAVGQRRFYSITPEPLLSITEWAQALLDAPALQIGEQEDITPNPQGDITHLAYQQGNEVAPSSPTIRVSQAVAYGTPDPEEESPMTDEVTLEQTYTPVVPHPTDAGILITPLMPFTPVFDENLIGKPGDAIGIDQVFIGRQAESTQALPVVSEGMPTVGDVKVETALQLKVMAKDLKIDPSDSPVPTPENLVLGEDLSNVQQVTVTSEAEANAHAEAAVAEAQERAFVTEAQAKEMTEERGLLSKLARWGRRGAR